MVRHENVWGLFMKLETVKKKDGCEGGTNIGEASNTLGGFDSFERTSKTSQRQAASSQRVT